MGKRLKKTDYTGRYSPKVVGSTSLSQGVGKRNNGGSKISPTADIQRSRSAYSSVRVGAVGVKFRFKVSGNSLLVEIAQTGKDDRYRELPIGTISGGGFIPIETKPSAIATKRDDGVWDLTDNGINAYSFKIIAGLLAMSPNHLHELAAKYVAKKYQ